MLQTDIVLSCMKPTLEGVRAPLRVARERNIFAILLYIWEDTNAYARLPLSE